MIVALLDNGSLEPAALRNLRTVAAALSARVGVAVEAVSWKHSDKIAPASLDGAPAWRLAPWVRTQVATGARDFVFVPFFISAQGAISSAVRLDLEMLSDQLGGISFAFTAGLDAEGAIAGIVAARVREALAANRLLRPPVILVDHGGPSPASAALRDKIAAQVRVLLADAIGPVAAASMEGAHGPLLADQLAARCFDHGDIVVAPLFLSPGRHAGPEGDLARIARSTAARRTPRRVHFTALVGTHPAAVEILAATLREALVSTATVSPLFA